MVIDYVTFVLNKIKYEMKRLKFIVAFGTPSVSAGHCCSFYGVPGTSGACE